MALEAQSDAHCRHALAVRIVFVTKYRRSVLPRKEGDRCKEIIYEVAAEIGVEILSVETEVNQE